MTDAAFSSPGRTAASMLAPIAALAGAILCLCVGTSFAKQLFPALGAEGTTAVRITLSAVMLVAVWRPWRSRLARRDIGAIALYGGTIGAMNLLFYLSIQTIPLGLAIAIEFSGPLTVALVSSRRAIDLLWVALAALGLGLLLPIGEASSALDPLGVAYALGAAVCWAAYIVFGQRVGHLPGGQAVALGMTFAALLVLPLGVAKAGAALLDPAILVAGLGVAALSSALPYSLEMVALKRLPRHVFGVFLSLEPAGGALAALVILGETLSGLEWLAVSCVVAASAGVAVTAHRAARIRARAMPA